MERKMIVETLAGLLVSAAAIPLSCWASSRGPQEASIADAVVCQTSQAVDDSEPSDSLPDDHKTSDNGMKPVAPVTPTIGPPDAKHRQAQSSGSEGFQWQSAVSHSLFFTAVQHAFRFSREAGSRDALRGPFWSDYIHSIGSLRGWDDGDGFVTSYVGHPMGGAVFGFIQVQNDPRTRTLKFNDGRDYWMSRLHALAFSAALSAQWTLGLFSEASLGNVQLYSSPGVVDLVTTPTLGLSWLIGEDVVDRYWIERLEEHTANRVLLLLARSFGNPTRSFANMMNFKRPWQRFDRPGLFGLEFVARSEHVRNRKEHGTEDRAPYAGAEFIKSAESLSSPAAYPREAPIELMASAHYETFLGGGSCVGGGGTGSVRIGPSWQIVGEVSGCLIVNMPVNESGDSLLYLVGPRWTPRAAHKISPYAQLLLGGRRITHETLDPALRDKLQKGWDAGEIPHYPKRSEYSTETSANGFSLLAGGGVDIKVNAAIAVRVVNFDYSRSFVPTVDRIDATQGVRFTLGLILRIGTW